MLREPFQTNEQRQGKAANPHIHTSTETKQVEEYGREGEKDIERERENKRQTALSSMLLHSLVLTSMALLHVKPWKKSSTKRKNTEKMETKYRNRE